MNKEFIPYEQALELKELGFREETLAYYSKNFNPKGNYEVRFASDSGSIIDWNEPDEENDYTYASAPLYQQAFRWFRENHSISSHIEEMSDEYDEEDNTIHYEVYIKSLNGLVGMARKTYEEAELACLKKLIEIVKDENRI